MGNKFKIFLCLTSKSLKNDINISLENLREIETLIELCAVVLETQKKLCMANKPASTKKSQLIVKPQINALLKFANFSKLYLRSAIRAKTKAKAVNL